MRIAVLGATGATGQQLVGQALQRGHEVVALVRDPERAATVLPSSSSIVFKQTDVTDPASVTTALESVDVVVSGLGVAKGDRPGILTAGAEAVLKAAADNPGLRVVWLSALGTGRSAEYSGPVWSRLLKLLIGAQLPDKVKADELLLPAGATSFHAGPLNNKALSPTRRTVALPDVTPRFLPGGISRATVAAAMLDEAENQAHSGTVVVPLTS